MKIVLAGTGNVGTLLGLALIKSGHKVIQVFSRSESSAKELSGHLDCDWCIHPEEIRRTADIYIISISDQSLSRFIKNFPVKNKTVVHTSGTIPLKVFAKKFTSYGVLYPVQTLSKGRDIQFNEVPLLIEGNNRKSITLIETLARSVSRFVFELNSEERKTVHLAAVLANNFTNHLYVLAEKILENKNLPFLLLGPLIQETSLKALQQSPSAVQTGPAKRGDTVVIEEHLKMLKKDKSLQKIYQVLSQSIEKESGIPL